MLSTYTVLRNCKRCDLIPKVAGSVLRVAAPIALAADHHLRRRRLRLGSAASAIGAVLGATGEQAAHQKESADPRDATEGPGNIERSGQWKWRTIKSIALHLLPSAADALATHLFAAWTFPDRAATEQRYLLQLHARDVRATDLSCGVSAERRNHVPIHRALRIQRHSAATAAKCDRHNTGAGVIHAAYACGNVRGGGNSTNENLLLQLRQQ